MNRFFGQKYLGGLYLFVFFWLTACTPIPAATPATAVSPPFIPSPPPTPRLLPTPAGTLPPTPEFTGSDESESATQPPPTETAVPPITLTAAPGLPPELVLAAQDLAARLPGQFAWTEQAPANVTLTLAAGRPLATWIYALAAPFATVDDGLSLPEVQAGWQGNDASSWQMFAAAELAHWPTAVLGGPHPDVVFLPVAEIAERAWAERPSLVILPFHRLTADMKLLKLDGRSPLEADFDPAAYPLTSAVNVAGAPEAVDQFMAEWGEPLTNWDPGKLTRVAVSGVTALTRATAFQMEVGGILTPGEAVRPVLEAADIAHISNEVSFSPDCPYPNPVGGTTFCSRTGYFELLASLGVDVVELTGNHLNDWGTDGLLYSLDLYQEAGMEHFGGGADSEAARRPALFEHNGNLIAFVGCNPVGPAYAWAGPEKPGARPCDEDFTEQIRRLAAEGFLVIATLQYNEFYHYAPTAQQVVDFAALAEAGAAAVSGSQAHHPQGFAFVDGAFIHYGLGNLFFDQMDQLGTRQSFIDTYYFYDGRFLTVTLWTGLIENFCCPRQMTAGERQGLLTAVFQASGW